MGGGLLHWLGGRREEPLVPVDDGEEIALPEGLSDQILTVESAALEIYRRAGLPTRAGSYVQRGPDAPWEPLGDNLGPAEKWDLLNSAPEGAGWRFVDRASLGRTSDDPVVRRASTLLVTCAGLKARLSGELPTSAQDVADALQLGAAAAWLAQIVASLSLEDHQPLTFVPIADQSAPKEKAAPRRKAAPKKPAARTPRAKPQR